MWNQKLLYQQCKRSCLFQRNFSMFPSNREFGGNNCDLFHETLHRNDWRNPWKQKNFSYCIWSPGQYSVWIRCITLLQITADEERRQHFPKQSTTLSCFSHILQCVQLNWMERHAFHCYSGLSLSAVLSSFRGQPNKWGGESTVQRWPYTVSCIPDAGWEWYSRFSSI